MLKNKRVYSIDRRNFLRGLGGLCVPLPLFDFMLNSNGTAYAQSNTPLPKRFMILKSGNSPSSDYDRENDITGNPRNYLVPLSFGANYKLNTTLSSLATFPGLQDYVGVFSNCAVNYRKNAGTVGSMSTTPPGGAYGFFHQCSNYPQMTGRRMWWVGTNSYQWDRGPSADQILKAALNPNGKFIHGNYLVQYDTPYYGSYLQFDSNGNGIAPNSSPRSIFNQLFGNFTPPAGQAPDPAKVAAFEVRKSILDYLDQDRVNFLKRNLSPRDQNLLIGHFDYIRDLEKRVNAVPPASTSPSCVRMNDPGADPARVSDNYYDEDKRANVIADLVAMAMACDIMRHATIKITSDQSFMSTKPFTGIGADFHTLTHYNDLTSSTELAMKAVGWVASKFFRVANALKVIPEGSGNVLDNSALVYFCEGGHGPSIDENFNFPVSHSLDNICLLVAGRAGNLKTGSHVKTNRAHPTSIMLAAMKAVGYQGNQIGDIVGHETSVWNG